MKSTLLVFASLLVCLSLVLGGCNQQEGKTLTVILTQQQDPLVVPAGVEISVASLFTYTGSNNADTNANALYYRYTVVSAPPGVGVGIAPGAGGASGGATGTVDGSAKPPVFPSAVFTFGQPGTYVMRLTMGQINGYISASNDHTYIVTAAN